MYLQLECGLYGFTVTFCELRYDLGGFDCPGVTEALLSSSLCLPPASCALLSVRLRDP